MIGILDYGIGNVSSIHNMFKKIGVPSVITSSPEEIQTCNKLILPGVGHFDYCMQQLKSAAFFELLQHKVLTEKIPVLGVCVGCQMLFENSEEGNSAGLGWISGSVIRFRSEKMSSGLKVPHMSWTDIHIKKTTGLYQGFSDEIRFYFVHSYHISCDPAYATATADYGYEFVASVKKDNISGVQFHPEKSHKFGMKLYENFANLVV